MSAVEFHLSDSDSEMILRDLGEMQTPRPGPLETYSRAIPNFSINSYIVGRLMPNSNAAGVIFPL